MKYGRKGKATIRAGQALSANVQGRDIRFAIIAFRVFRKQKSPCVVLRPFEKVVLEEDSSRIRTRGAFKERKPLPVIRVAPRSLLGFPLLETTKVSKRDARDTTQILISAGKKLRNCKLLAAKYPEV